MNIKDLTHFPSLQMAFDLNNDIQFLYTFNSKFTTNANYEHFSRDGIQHTYPPCALIILASFFVSFTVQCKQ